MHTFQDDAGQKRSNPNKSWRGPPRSHENSVMSSEWERCVLDRVCICLYRFACVCFQKNPKAQANRVFSAEYFRWPQVFPGFPMGFSRFPRKKRSIGLRCRPPLASIHLEKFMYPLALVSGAPHKAYIFRFNTPTNNTFPASGTHTCLILRGYRPLVPIHFWQKVRGLVNPPPYVHTLSEM